MRAGREERWAVAFLALHEPAEPGWTEPPAVEPGDTAHSHLPWHFLASLPGQPVLFLSTEFLSHCLQFSHTSDSPTPS